MSEPLVETDACQCARNRRQSTTTRPAWRWQRMLDGGVYASVSEIGDTENISKSYVSRILRLALLSPDMITAILAGSADQSLMLERLERPLPASWEEQQRLVPISR